MVGIRSMTMHFNEVLDLHHWAEEEKSKGNEEKYLKIVNVKENMIRRYRRYHKFLNR